MSKSPNQQWKSRREIPDPLVKDVADQYEAARKLLADQPPMSGILMPMMNLAAVAIELYLKSMCAETVHVAELSDPKISQVYAQPSIGHSLVQFFDAIPERLRDELGTSHSNKVTFRDRLSQLEGSFMRTRYPYEPDSAAGELPYRELMDVSLILSQFVDCLETSETIEWE